MILTFDSVSTTHGMVILTMGNASTQLRHDFTASAAQLLKTGPEVILQCSKTVQGSTKGRKVQSKKKREGHCVFVCVGVCLLPDVCHGTRKAS